MFAYNNGNKRSVNGGINVKERLLKSTRYGQVVDVMYLAKNGDVTKRRIKVIKLYCDSFQAYCFLRKTKRTFKVYSILALIPVQIKERAIV